MSSKRVSSMKRPREAGPAPLPVSAALDADAPVLTRLPLALAAPGGPPHPSSIAHMRLLPSTSAKRPRQTGVSRTSSGDAAASDTHPHPSVNGELTTLAASPAGAPVALHLTDGRIVDATIDCGAESAELLDAATRKGVVLLVVTTTTTTTTTTATVAAAISTPLPASTSAPPLATPPLAATPPPLPSPLTLAVALSPRFLAKHRALSPEDLTTHPAQSAFLALARALSPALATTLHDSSSTALGSDARPFDTAALFEAIKPGPNWPEYRGSLPALVPVLRPYQRRAVAWMLGRERASEVGDAFGGNGGRRVRLVRGVMMRGWGAGGVAVAWVWGWRACEWRRINN